MSDVEPLASDAPENDAPQVATAPSSGIFRDPVVRIMAYAAVGLVILFLATAVSALVTGVLRPNVVRTAAERQALVASAAVQSGGTGDAWAPYINALVAAGDLRQAQMTLDRARASVETTVAPNLDLAEGRLLTAQKRYEEAAEAAGRAMEGYVAQKEARMAARPETATADPVLLVPSYYDAALVKAYACVELGRWGDAVEMFDLYIIQYPTAADILVDRGQAKVELGDNAGAEKDFREALRFVPYDQEAKDGLARIGAAQ